MTIFSAVMTIDGFSEFLARISGLLLYLILGTVGLFWLGMWRVVAQLDLRAGLKDSTNGRPGFVEDRAVAIFLLFSVFGIFFITGLHFTHAHGANRLDHWMYGRYIEGSIAPILIIGTLKTNFRRILWSIPLVLISTAILAHVLKSYTHVAYFNCASFWQLFVIKDYGIWAWTFFGLAWLMFVAIAPRKMGLVFVACVFILSAYLNINWHIKAYCNQVEKLEYALVVRQNFNNKDTCVAFDHSGIDSYRRHTFWFDAGYYLYDYRLMRMSPSQWYRTCDGPLFSYDPLLEKRFSDVSILARSEHGGPLLYQKDRHIQ
jgi:hypothetical protein